MASASEEGQGFFADDYDSLIATTDVELLKKAWRNEKAAPEILPFQAGLVQRSREQIQLMEDTVEDFTNSGTDPLTLSLYQMDLDRTLFVLRSYLRVRLQKIEKYMIHISKTDLWSRLSEQEQKFAIRCTDDMEEHFKESVLKRLPDGYKSILKQSTSSEEDDMGKKSRLLSVKLCGDVGMELESDLLSGAGVCPVCNLFNPDVYYMDMSIVVSCCWTSVPEPHLDTFVFCKSKSSVGAFQLDDSGDEIVDLVADDLYVLRYKSIKALVVSGQIDLV